jgi:uncharacterized FAD-dependent dehydrogenase
MKIYDNAKHHYFIGMGPANVYAVLYLLKNGVDGSTLHMFDKGKEISKRDRKKDVLEGYLGSGMYTDGKMVYSRHKDQEFNELFNYDDVTEAFSFIQKSTEEFHPNPESISITIPEELPESLTSNGIEHTHQAGWGELSIKTALCHHVGSEAAIPLALNMQQYFIDNRVDMHFEEEVLDINVENKVLVTTKDIYSYDELFIAVGRANKKFISKLYEKYQVPSEDVEYQIGGRFEMQFNDTVKELTKFQYDFKFNKEYTDKVSVRSFCVCNHSAYVVSEQHDGYTQVNGEGYGLSCSEEHVNNLTNFGIIATVKGPHSDLDKIVNKFKTYGGKPWYIKGVNFNYKSSFSGPTYYCDNEVFKDLYKDAGDAIIKFIEDLNPALAHNGNWIMYFPEIKPTGSKITFNNDLSITNLPNVYILGDSGVLNCRGIVPSAVTGIMAVNMHVLDKYSN